MATVEEIRSLRIALGVMCIVIHVQLVIAVVAASVGLAFLSLTVRSTCMGIIQSAEGIAFASLIAFDIILQVLMKKVNELGSGTNQCQTEKAAFEKLCKSIFGVTAFIILECIAIFLTSFNLLDFTGLMALILVQIVSAIVLTVMVGQLKSPLASYLGCVQKQP